MEPHRQEWLRFESMEENPVATILHYACHGTTMGWQTEFLHTGFPGPEREVVERELGGTCLFLQGATAGNLTPRRGFTGDCRVYRDRGTILGLEAAKVAWNLETLPRQERLSGSSSSGAPIAIYDVLRWRRTRSDCTWYKRHFGYLRRSSVRLRNWKPSWHAFFTEVNGLRKEGDCRTRSGWRRLRPHRRAGARNIAKNYYGKETSLGVDGDCPWLVDGAWYPCRESRLLRPRRPLLLSRPLHTRLFSGYSNGGFGYIPTRAAYGEGGYETEATPFGRRGGDADAGSGSRIERIAQGAIRCRTSTRRKRPDVRSAAAAATISSAQTPIGERGSGRDTRIGASVGWARVRIPVALLPTARSRQCATSGPTGSSGFPKSISAATPTKTSARC